MVEKFVICHRYKFIFCLVPKAACSSILEWILRLENDRKIDSFSNERSKHIYIHSNNTHKFVKAQEVCTIYKHYIKFVIVRNPYTRIISSYNNKFIDAYKNKIWLNTPWKKIALNFGGGITFREFIHFIQPSSCDVLKAEPHWDLQKNIAQTDIIKYDHVLKFEDLYKDIQCLFDTLNIPNNHRSLPLSNSSNSKAFSVNCDVKNTETDEHISSKIYDLHADIQQTIKEKYKDDFLEFDYNF